MEEQDIMQAYFERKKITVELEGLPHQAVIKQPSINQNGIQWIELLLLDDNGNPTQWHTLIPKSDFTSRLKEV